MKVAIYDSGIGVLPFIKVILKEKIYNDYYIFIDHKNFPYGLKNDKSLLKIFLKIIRKIEKYNFDYLIICCNTMSKIFLDNHIKTKVKVITILQFNIKYINDYKLLATSSLAKKIHQAIDGGNLAQLIEDNDIINIIKIIKSLPNKIILGCTHYHLLKQLICFYQTEYLSLEKEVFNHLPSCNNLNIYVKKKDYKVLKNYIKIGMKFY